MNKVFRIVWSEARQAWLVVSELTKIKGKSKAESQGQDIQSAVAFSSIFSSFPFHLLPHIVLLGLFSLSLPAEAAKATLGGGTTPNGDDNTVAIIGAAGPGSIAIGGGDNTLKANATGRTSVAIGYKADTGNYDNAVAVGNLAKGLGNSSVAIGDNATVSGSAKNAVVIGKDAEAIVNNTKAQNGSPTGGDSPAAAVAIGNKAKAAYASVAIGNSALANVSQTIAIGDQAKVFHNNAIAIGVLANATNNTANAIGYGAKATGDYAFALGSNSTASAKSALAVNYEAKASGEASIALGRLSNATGLAASALSAGAQALANRTIAIGENKDANGGHTTGGAKASAEDAISIGTSSAASAKYTIAMGREANATKDDAVALGHNAKALEAQSVVLGSNSTSNASGAIALGSDVIASGYSSIAIGGDDLDNTTYQEKGGSKYINTTSAGKGSVAIGAKSKANSDGSVVLGVVANATGNESMALGALSHANGTHTVALGASSNATAEYAIAIGSNASAASYSVAVGKDSVANQTGSTALGENAKATQQRATALGNNSNATIANGSVAIGYLSVTTKDKGDTGWKQASSNYSALSSNVQNATHAAVAIGNNSTVTRQITGLAAGSADTDAVNVAQLKSLTLELKAGNEEGNVTLSNEKLEIKGAKGITTNVSNNVVTVTGSGLTVTPDSNGTYSSANSTLDIKTNDAWNADNNGGRYSGDNIETRKTSTGILIGIKEEPTFKKVTINGNGPVLSSTGIAMNNQKITGLKAGEQDTDAVNKKQLDDSIGSTTYKAQHGETNGYTIKHNQTKTITIKPGDITNGGNFKGLNLATSVDNNGNITIGFKEDPSFKDVTASNSIKINGGITINSTGIDMGAGGNRKITNLANGTESNDAVNVSQLEEVKNSIKNIKGSNVDIQSATEQITVKKEGDTVKVGAKVVDDIETGWDGKASVPKEEYKKSLATANATMAAVNNASWLVKTTDQSGLQNPKDNNKDWVYINPGDNVVYENGTGTTAVVSNKETNGKDTLTVKVNVNTGTTEVDNTGKAKPKNDDTDKDKIATLGDITKTINDTFWKATSGTVNEGVQEGNPQEEKIKAGDTVTFKAGKNLKITQQDKSFIYAVTESLNNISSISNGADNVGTKITLSPDSKKIDVHNAVISNVSTPQHDNDAANKKYVDDLGNKGITFQANTNKTKAIKLGDTVSIVGSNPNQITTTADGNGKVSIGAKTILVDVFDDGRAHLPKWAEKKEGSGESLVTADALIRAVNNAGFFVKTTNQSGEVDLQGNKDWAWISPGYRVVYGNGTGTTVKVEQTKDPKANVNKNTLLNVRVDVNTGNSTVNSDGKAAPATDDDKDKIATIGNITDTINKTYWKATSGAVDGGQNVSSSQAQIKAGDMVTFNAGKNMKITQNGSTFTYALMDNLSNITSISNGGDSGTKITLSPNEKNVDVGGAKITNVSNPTEGGDVVNKTYLDQQITANKGLDSFTVGADKSATANGITVNKESGQNRFDIVGKDGVATKVSGRQIEVGLDPETKGKIETANTAVTTKGITFVSDGENKTQPIKLGDELKVSGASNIKTSVSSDGKALNIGLEDNVKLSLEGDITIGPDSSTHSKLAFDGLTIKGKPGTKEISVTKDGIKAGDKKITDVAAGDLKEKGTDAVNAGQLYTVQQEAKKRTSVKAKADQQIVSVTKSDKPNQSGGDEYVVDVDTSKVMLTYKANGKDGKTVSLTDGLNFTDTDNITATVEASGVVKHALKSALTGIQSIAGKTTNGKEATTITLSEDPNDKKVTLNTAKLTGLKEGAVSESSTDAVSGKQLHNFVKVNNKAAEQGGSVNFVNSTTTSVSADNAGNVTITVNNTTLPVSDGKVTAPSEENKTKFVNASDLATALGNLSFKVQATGANLIEEAKNNTSAQDIKFGDTVQFEAGDNLLVGRTEKKFTYRLASNLSNITSISNGGEKGTKITLSPDEKKIDVGGARITNVSNPTDNNDVVNKKYVDDLSKDLGNKGITFVSDGDKRTKAIKLGEQLKIVGANPKQITTTANENGTISIGAKTIPIDIGEDGRAFLPKLWTEQKGGDGENLVTANTVIRAINNTGFFVKTTNQSGEPDTKGNKEWAWISPGYRVVYENGTGTTVSVEQTKDPKANVDKSTLLNVKVDVNTGNSTVNGEGKAIPKTDEDKDKIATLGDITDTINKIFWKATSGTVDGGIQDGQASVVNMKAGDMLTLKAGKNMKITQEDKSFTYALKEAIDLTSVTTGNTSMNNEGITIKAPANAQDGRSNVTLTANGLDNGGNKITHVADGEIKQDSKDAVNGSQLYTVQEEAKKHTSVKAKDGQQIVTVEKSQQKNANGGDEYVVSVNTANINVKYKANGQNEQSVSVDKGFNFTDTDNITASVDADGVVKHALKSALTGVNSITAKTADSNTGEATKITLSTDPKDKKVELNTAKLTGLKEGDVSDSSTDAVSGKQLHNLVKVNNNAAEKNGSVNFVNSTTTNLSAGNDGNITINVNNTTLPVSDGKVTQLTEENKAKFVNAGDLATALGNLSFKVQATGTNLIDSAKDNTGAQEIKFGDTVQFEAGDNLLVGRTDKKFTYRLASNLTNIDSISNGKNGQGTKITLSPNENKIDVGGARITNVSNPTADSDAVNKKYVDDVNNTLGNKGITFVSDGDKKTKPIKLGEKIKFTGENPNQITTSIDGKGAVSIGVKTATEFEIGFDGKANLNNNHKDSLATAAGVISAVNDASWLVKTTDQSGFNNGGNKDWVYVNPGDNVVYANGVGTTVKVSNQVDPKTQKDTVTVKYDVNTGTSTVDEQGKAKPTTDEDKNKIATLEDITNTINGTFWKATSGTVDGGIQDGQTSVVNMKAGDMLTFKAGKNLKVKQDGNSFIYSLNDALSGISSISNGDDGVGTKITLSDQEKKVDVGGAKITNVAKPTEDGDAANKKYVDDLGNTLSNKGITFVSDGNTKNKTNPIKLGDELKVTGASNIKTSVSEDGSALNIGLTDDVQLSLEGEVTIGPKSGNRYTTLEYDGLTVKTGTPNAKDIAVTKDGIKAGDKKITDVADGNVTKDSKEAVNGSQLYTVQEEAKKRTSVKAADNQQIVNVTKSQQANETGGDEYVVSVDTSKVMLKYKANGKNDQNVSLTDGLNFTDTDNITATVDKNGVVKHALNSALVGVTSITAKKVADGEEEATKITLSEDPNDKKVTLNSAKITGLQDGTIADNSSDAINGKQLHNLVKVNGNAAEKNGSVNFVDSATTSVSAGNDGNVTITVNNTTLSVNGGKVTAPTNDADKAKFVNAGDLANVLGNLSFKVQATGNNLIDSAKDTSEKEIKFGDTVQFEAGENLLVGRTDKKFTYRLASNLTNIGSISNGENGKGTKITLSPTEKNVDVGGAKITNVGAPQDNSDAVNKKYVDDLNKALSNKGITFATDTGKTNPIKLGEQIKFTSGNPDQLTTEVDKNSAIKIGLKTIGSLGVGWDGKAYVDDAHKNSLVTATGVISAVNDASWLVKTTDQSGLDNKGNKDWVYINPGDNVVYENGVGTTVKVSNKVENGKDTVTVKYDVNTGTSTVGDNGKAKPTNGDADKDKIATLGDITNTINSTFWKVTSGTDGGSEAEGTKKSEQPIKAGDMVSLKAGKNLTIKQDGANFTFALSDTLKIDNLNVGEKGADGKPGEDGKISVNGKDGSSVVLNGKDGSIGLNGKDGKDGVTIKSADGAAGLGGKPGEHKTRIVYERKDPKDPNKTITEEVATLEDGQQYSADNYAEQDDNTVIKKKLNQRLEIKGGADGSKLTDNNIGVIVDSGVLRVKLAQQINLGNEGALITGRTKVNNDGITITPTTSADGSTKKPVSLSENGLDNGGNRITNVANGVADSDAVNKGQLTAAAKGAKTEVQSEDSSIEVTETQGKDKQTIYDLSVVKSGLTVSDDKRTLTADKAGNAFVTGETVANAVNTATAAARTEVTSDNGSITLDPTVGKNGQEIYDLAVAKSNLTISPDGKTVSADKQGEAFVTGANVADMLNKAVASARTAVEGGTNVQVSAQNAPDGHDIYTVSVEGDLTNISSISNDGTQISLGKDDKGNKAVNVNGAKIGGVADGVADSDAVNMGQLTAAAKGAKTEVQSEDSSIEVTETQGKDKQTIYDLSVVKSGLTVSDDKRTLTADKAGNAFVTGETVASAVNTATAAARTEVVEGKNIQVVEQTGEHGQNVYNLSISGLPMEYVTTDNKPVVNMGGKFYLEEVKDSGEVKLTPVVNNNGKFLTQTINPDGTISLNPIQVKVNLANKTPMQLGNIADGTADNDAVNVRQLKATKTEVESTDNSVVISERQGENKQTVYNLSVAKTGLTLSDDKRTVSADFAGNHFATGEEVAKAINATAAAARTEVIGGTNVKVKTEIGEKGQNRYTLSVSGDLTDIHSISNGDTKLSLSKDNEGNPVVNVNGARVSNVADARADGDAINAKQLKNVVNAIGAGMDRLSRDIQNVDSNARAGIAAAGAMANLPQVYLPGKSAVAIAGAYYRGQSAYALGYSRTSDNGKWIIRASAANNTQQDVMVGAGASYIW
ncbi:MAG: YadA-like family protein [[Pasteurella] mairii]|nr:YadA-like family protein [[Pasteurella] mairii]